MTTALYRRYRPDTFEDVIGQEHVTGALQNALSGGRVAHAFLFSGPRGCGKTTSARILARSLNCAQGPTPTPCGECDSCVELASGGSGSLDVMEIDAASNSGVDAARDLRGQTEFAPVRDRYRIFILDEAHMVTPQGFNALLKVVEEPPEHVKFIFATTEPEKVISTIRSRTHHYPFRLVPPNVLMPYLQSICAQEEVTVEQAALPLVIRAGGGSVRDSLSVLDQLIAGSEGDVTLRQASRLLGFTDSALLDRMIEALGANDGGSAFSVVEEIIGSGHEPRRFAEDLLQRLRDIIIAALAGPELSADILVGTPADQLATMLTQASQWGTKLLSRRADMVEEALREMTGATAPRLQLELLVARLLVEQPAGATVDARAGAAATPRPEQTSSGATPVVERSPARPSPVGERTSVAPIAAEKSITPVDAEPGVIETEAEAVATGGDVRESPGSLPPQLKQKSTVELTVPTAPTTDEVRSQWRALLTAMGARSALYGSLLGATRGVEPVGDTVRFTFAEDSYVERFKNMNGERDLAEVLSDLFGVALKAEVGTAAQFKERDAAGQSSDTEERRTDGGANTASLDHTGTPQANSRTRAGETGSLAPDALTSTDYGARAAGSEQVEPGRQDSDLPEYTDDDEPALDQDHAETVITVPKVEAEADAHEDAELEARYRGVPAADRVLDILGGQVIEVLQVKPEDQ